MPPGFRTSVSADLWTPLRPTTTGEGSGANYTIVARLEPGTTWAQADFEVRSLEEEAFAELRVPSDMSVRLRWISLQDALIDFSRKPLLIVWAAGGLVLFIGCVNIASLLLARGAERTHELATRVALGGGRAALVRQLLSESLVLAACGGVVGVALGYFGVQELQAFLREGFDIFQEGEGFHIWQEVTLGGRVLVVMLGVSLVTSVLFGLYPAWHAARVDIRQALVEGGSRGPASRRSRWPRRFLVIGEVALGTVLLVGAGLLVRTFSNLSRLNPGFDPENVLTASISLHDARYDTSATVNRLFEQSLDRIRELPGIEYAAVSLRLPYERGLNIGFRLEDGTDADRSGMLTNLTYVTEDYFQALRIPITLGRSFDFRERQDDKSSLIVNEVFVEKHLSGRDPIGARIVIDGEAREIVGVVASVIQKSSGFGSYGPVDRIPAAYIPARQVSDGFFSLVHTWFAPTWVVRSARPATMVIDTVQRSVTSVDPYLPFAGFNTMQGLMSRALSQQRIQATLLGILAGIALLLALVGIYGLVARTVVERTREMGLRMALGATLSQSVRSAALPGMMLSLVGVVIGGFIAILATRTLRSLIWGISSSDPTTLVTVAVGLLLVATLASFLPALRIAWLDPARTLREQ
jgi:predicted permease